MLRLKKYRAARKARDGEFKIIVAFQSVHDSLFNTE